MKINYTCNLTFPATKAFTIKHPYGAIVTELSFDSVPSWVFAALDLPLELLLQKILL